VFRSPGLTSYLALEAGVEQAGGVIERRAFEEGQLDHGLVGLAGADAAVVLPHGYAGARCLGPLPLLDDVGDGLLDDRPQLGQRVAAPVVELLDPVIDLLRSARLAGHRRLHKI